MTTGILGAKNCPQVTGARARARSMAEQFGGVPGDGAAAGPEGGGFGGQSRRPGLGVPVGPSATAGPSADGRRVRCRGRRCAQDRGRGRRGRWQPEVARCGLVRRGSRGRPRRAGMPRASPRQGRRRGKRRPSMSWWVELPILLVFALVLALLIKSFVVQAFFIPSSSMENTLEIGDKVLVNKLVYDFRSIHRGDVIVFNGDGSWDPVPGPDRAAAQPDLGLGLRPFRHRARVSMTTSSGSSASPVTTWPAATHGARSRSTACRSARSPISTRATRRRRARFSITVPPGRLWVMGDHRSVSWDSRGHMSDPGRRDHPGEPRGRAGVRDRRADQPVADPAHSRPPSSSRS